MSFIHLVGGEKGGVGKTLFALCLVHYFDVKGIERYLVDADPRIPDVASVYGGITDLHFQSIDRVSSIHSQQVQKLDKLFELALEKPVIVNLPGNVHDATFNWLIENELLSEEVIKESFVNFCKWFLSDGSDTSIDLFAKSLQDYQGKLPHILVINQGLNPYWSKLTLSNKLQQLAHSYSYLAIEFPGLALAERNYLKQNNISFSKAFADKKLSILSRQRLVKFLRNTMSEIELIFSSNNFLDAKTSSNEGAAVEVIVDKDAIVEAALSEDAIASPESITTPDRDLATAASTNKSTVAKSRRAQAKNSVAAVEDTVSKAIESAS